MPHGLYSVVWWCAVVDKRDGAGTSTGVGGGTGATSCSLLVLLLLPTSIRKNSGMGADGGPQTALPAVPNGPLPEPAGVPRQHSPQSSVAARSMLSDGLPA